jgi:hypothetical protein
MTFEDIKTAVMQLSVGDKKKFFLEVLPSVWPACAGDEACVAKIKELIDMAAEKNYTEQHMGNV